MTERSQDGMLLNHARARHRANPRARLHASLRGSEAHPPEYKRSRSVLRKAGRPPSVERFLQAAAREIIEKKTNAPPESRLLFGDVYQTCLGHGSYSDTENERYDRLGVSGDARKALRILEHGATFGGTVVAVVFPKDHAGCVCFNNSKIVKNGVPNIGVDYSADGPQARVAHRR